jgi:hypothetical protein
MLLAIAAASGAGCYAIQGCHVNYDCPVGSVCLSGSCQPSLLRGCNVDGDCNSGETCFHGACQPDCVTQGCPQGDRCDSQTHQCLAIVYAGTSGDPPTTTGTGGTTTGGSTGSSTTGGTTTGGTTGAVAAPFCSSCAGGVSCGPVTSVCMTDQRGFQFCGVDCTDGQTCPTGSSCIATDKANPLNAQTIYNCFPNSFLCYCSPNGDTWGNYAQAFFTNTCQACHSQYSGQLTQFTSYQNVQQASTIIQVQLGYDNMPRAPVNITQDERTRILNWLDCGLPE